MGNTTILALPHSYELVIPFQSCLDPWVSITNSPELKVQSCLQLKGKVCILKKPVSLSLAGKTVLVAQYCRSSCGEKTKLCLPYQQYPSGSNLICNAGTVFVNPQNGACPRIFNYSWFMVVMENILHYSEIYIKGYQDTHPINILLMFKLSFCKWWEGGISEQLKWFISDTDMHWKGAEGGPAGLAFLQCKKVCRLLFEWDPHPLTLFSSTNPTIRHADLCRSSDLILSKGLAAAPASL